MCKLQYKAQYVARCSVLVKTELPGRAVEELKSSEGDLALHKEMQIRFLQPQSKLLCFILRDYINSAFI